MSLEYRVTKGEKGQTRTASPLKINDIGFRVILIPFFGIAIPLVTGMMDITKNIWEFKLSFVYTIATAFLIWEGNRFLLFTLRAYFDWFEKPVRKVIVLLLVIIFYTIPVSVLLLAAWYKIFSQRVDWHVVYLSTLIIFICVLFIVHVYETVFLVKEAESERVKKAQLEKAKLQTELEALKNQLDPHFVFNSLNIMEYLIEENPLRAKQFAEHLSDVYRYILLNKAKDFVLLTQEIQFVENYFFLQKIRFENAIVLLFLPVKKTLQDLLILPMSLQILVENAVKHNEFSDLRPLIITVEIADHFLSVMNDKKVKKLIKPSSAIGLENLNERYKLLTGKQIQISEDENRFIARLPLLKAN
jgi:sensor histidine kinase YesM